MLDIGGFVFDGMGYECDLRVGIRILVFFDRFACCLWLSALNRKVVFRKRRRRSFRADK